MDLLIARVQRIQKDLLALSNELDEVLCEHTPQQPPVVLPARKRGRPKKADAEAREAAKEIHKAEEAANTLVAVQKPTKKLKAPTATPISVQEESTLQSEESQVKICRTCGIDLNQGADHRYCFFASGFKSSNEWTQDCIAYAKEIGAGVAYAAT
jgi:hypothetical protein